jgi:N-acetylglucosamine kinase-like BadF-type ATPase
MGEVAAENEAASATLAAAGYERAGAALEELLAGLPLDRSVPLDAICAGSAGLSIPGAAEFLRERLSPLARAGTIVIVSDAMLALAAAGVDEGVAVICGTGSVAVGSYRDRAAQAGGWGYLLGDEGGGYWIVREAIRVLLRRRDCRQPLSDLGGGYEDQDNRTGSCSTP